MLKIQVMYIALANKIFVARNVECDSYVTFYAEFKNVIRNFLSPIGYVWRRILNIGFWDFRYSPSGNIVRKTTF
jgi:hypothetical protein